MMSDSLKEHLRWRTIFF